MKTTDDIAGATNIASSIEKENSSALKSAQYMFFTSLSLIAIVMTCYLIKWFMSTRFKGRMERQNIAIMNTMNSIKQDFTASNVPYFPVETADNDMDELDLGQGIELR